MPRTTRTPSSDHRFRASNISLATFLALASESSLSKNASSACSFVATRRTRSPSQQTTCLRATAFTASQQWRPNPGCHHDSSKGVSSRRLACRRNSTLGSSDSTPPWITSSDGPAGRGRRSPTITTSTIRCIWSTTVVPSRASPLRGSWRTSRACPSSIHSSRLKTVYDISKSSLGVAFLLSSCDAILYDLGRDATFLISNRVTSELLIRRNRQGDHAEHVSGFSGPGNEVLTNTTALSGRNQ